MVTNRTGVIRSDFAPHESKKTSLSLFISKSNECSILHQFYGPKKSYEFGDPLDTDHSLMIRSWL